MRIAIQKIVKMTKSFRNCQKGFTLIELLVVVAILGVLAAVAIPSVGKFVNAGDDVSYGVELHNVQTAVTTMMTEAVSRKVDDNNDGAHTADLSEFWSWADSAHTKQVFVSDYMVGLEGTTVVKTGCQYEVDADGNVIQWTPAMLATE